MSDDEAGVLWATYCCEEAAITDAAAIVTRALIAHLEEDSRG